ncbi:unnamed protein product, partial [Mesorhabditis spiculigera]
MEKTDGMTDWRKIIISGIIWLLSAVEDHIIGVSEWPYMSTIDPKATTSFFGVATAMSHAGHAIGAMVFALWRRRFKTAKHEVFPENRRYLMMVCYFLFGLGLGSMSVIRSYIADVSTEGDRSRAYAVTNCAGLMAIVLGPVIQLAFSAKTFEYPGHNIIGHKILFNFYTAPIYFATGMNIIAILATLFFFVDVRKEQLPTISPVGSFWEQIQLLLKRSGVVWPIVLLCLFQIVSTRITSITVGTVTAPLFMSGYGWDGHKTVMVMAIGQAVVGIICVAIAALFVFARLGQRIHARITFMFGLVITVGLYIITYPWPKITVPVAVWNETSGLGCNPKEYGWCDGHVTQPAIWITLLVLVMGAGLPFLMISLDTIYSKVLGSGDQSMLQGVNMLVEDLTLVIGAIYSTAIFTKSGQGILWIVNGSITFIAAALWIASYRALAPYR